MLPWLTAQDVQGPARALPCAWPALAEPPDAPAAEGGERESSTVPTLAAPPAASEAASPGVLPSGPCSPAAEVAGPRVFSLRKPAFGFACAAEVLGPEHHSVQAAARSMEGWI